MRTIKTTTSASITLDGDLLAILETLYREVTVRRNFERSFEDMIKEIQHLIDQMTEEERRAYLAESLFLNRSNTRTTGRRRSCENCPRNDVPCL